MIFRKIRNGAAVVLTIFAIGFAAPSANAQLGGIVDQVKNRAEREAREAAEQAVAKTLFPLEVDSADPRRTNPYLDRYAPARFGDMSALPRTQSGGFVLRPGAWRFTAQSYCLSAGHYEKPGGAGYMSGPITGKMAPYVRSILGASHGAPDIPQRHIQRLLWGVLSGVEIREMNAASQAAAATLLTPEQISDLNGGPAGFVPYELSSRALRKLPRSARDAYNAQRRLRIAAANPRSSYADLEAIAVRGGVAPRSDDDIPAGRWSWHPDGYFIRYDSSSYSKTVVEIVVPERSSVVRDSQGRIIEWNFSNGDRVRTTYAGGAPIRSSIYPQADGHRFASIEIRAFDRASGGFKTTTKTVAGWAFVETGGSRRGEYPASGVRYASASGVIYPVAMLQSGEITVVDITEINERAQEARERTEFIQERHRRATEPPSREDVDQFLDMEHYQDGIEAAFGGPSDRHEWLIDHFEREARALAYATEQIASLLDGTEDGAGAASPAYEPSGESALPSGSGSLQRRGVSGRGF